MKFGVAISDDMCIVHNSINFVGNVSHWELHSSTILMLGNVLLSSLGIAVKFGINTTLVALKMEILLGFAS